MPPTMSLTRSIRATVAAGLTAAAVVAALAGTTASAGAAVAAAGPSCPTAGLVVWLDTQGNGAAGSTYYELRFTNLSGHACSLRGYPGVSAIGLSGGRLGSPAARDTARAPKTITLNTGATATTNLRIVQAANFSPALCGPVTAAGLRVFPPNQAASRTIPFPFPACSRTRILSVQAVR